MCRQLSIRSSVEVVLITLDYITLHYQYPLSFYLVCNYLVCNFFFFFFFLGGGGGGVETGVFNFSYPVLPV